MGDITTLTGGELDAGEGMMMTPAGGKIRTSAKEEIMTPVGGEPKRSLEERLTSKHYQWRDREGRLWALGFRDFKEALEVGGK